MRLEMQGEYSIGTPYVPPKPETERGGLLIPADLSYSPNFVQIEQAGPGGDELDEDGNPLELQINHSDIAIVATSGGSKVSLDGKEKIVVGRNETLGILLPDLIPK